MRFLRCVHAEFLLVIPRLTRTRLGISLLALGTALVWLTAHALDPLTATLHAAALGAIVSAADMAGQADDRTALATALTHPTNSLAVATGRWLAIFVPAAGLTLTCAVSTGSHAGAAAAGLATAAAVGGCAVVAVLMLGNTAALALFLLMAVAGSIAPERVVALAHPGVLRLTAASVLELGPALWHYRDIATGDWNAMLHAVAWAGLGVLLASAVIGRSRSHR